MNIPFPALLVLLVGARQVGPRPAQIILFRHAEKPADPANPHLSPDGVARAAKLAGFLTSDPIMIRFGAPAAIFATKTTKDANGQRTQETVAPLAKALNRAVETPFLGREYKGLARLILETPAYAGKTVIICWNHENIPQLAAALGVHPKPPPWKGSVYGRVYVITYRKGKASLEEVKERL